MAEKALSGFKVVEYGNFVSAPFCGKLMADLGAEVIKVEMPGSGDESRQHGPFPNDVPHPERSGLFLNLNTNKLGITLNLETTTGRKVLKALVKETDVFIENNPPGIMKELGLDYATLKGVNERLVMTSISGFGQTGPYKDYKAYDINCTAAGGVSRTMGTPDREPLTAPLFQYEYQAALNAMAATLAALLARDFTGRGQHVDISVAEVALLHIGIYVWDGLHGVPRGRGYRQVYPSGILPCKDGYITMSAPQVAQWIRFLEIMGNPEWTNNPRYRNRRAMGEEYPEEVDALMEPWMREHTKEEIFALCREKHIPFAPVKTIDEVVDDAHLKARGFFVDVDRAETGVAKYPGAPYKFSETPWKIERPAPLLGEHNEEIYCKRLGYTRKELVELRRAGVI